jgi:RNA polymerase sigma-70 factor (ECF subfamily)
MGTFDQVFRENAPFVWRTLRRLGVREADVDDVCQEVFVVVHRKLAEFEGRSSLRTWIYGICIRTASAHRKLARHREMPTDSPPEREAEGTPHESLARRRALEKLDRALGELDEDKRTVFVLYEIEELGMAEIAEIVGCPLQTAYSRLHAARDKVQAAMKEAK